MKMPRKSRVGISAACPAEDCKGGDFTRIHEIDPEVFGIPRHILDRKQAGDKVYDVVIVGSLGFRAAGRVLALIVPTSWDEGNRF